MYAAAAAAATVTDAIFCCAAVLFVVFSCWFATIVQHRWRLMTAHCRHNWALHRTQTHTHNATLSLERWLAKCKLHEMRTYNFIRQKNNLDENRHIHEYIAFIYFVIAVLRYDHVVVVVVCMWVSKQPLPCDTFRNSVYTIWRMMIACLSLFSSDNLLYFYSDINARNFQLHSISHFVPTNTQ